MNFRNIVSSKRNDKIITLPILFPSNRSTRRESRLCFKASKVNGKGEGNGEGKPAATKAKGRGHEEVDLSLDEYEVLAPKHTLTHQHFP